MIYLFICERCGKEHDGSFGSGRFCSRSCANSRKHSDETKRKMRESANKYVLEKFDDPDTGVFISKREKRKMDRKRNLDALRDFVYASSDVKFLTYPDIDFGENYIISKCGRVISFKTLKCLSKAFKNYDDLYVRYVLTDVNGDQHMITAHRLVAYNFIPNPNNLPLINHKDCNPSNNNVDNLEWCTYQYNATYNDAHIKRGKVLSEYLKKNGGVWNKGKRMKRK